MQEGRPEAACAITAWLCVPWRVVIDPLQRAQVSHEGRGPLLGFLVFQRNEFLADELLQLLFDILGECVTLELDLIVDLQERHRGLPEAVVPTVGDGFAGRKDRFVALVGQVLAAGRPAVHHWVVIRVPILGVGHDVDIIVHLEQRAQLQEHDFKHPKIRLSCIFLRLFCLSRQVLG